MDKMKETSRIVLTISIFLFIAWCCGGLNYNIIRDHKTADPALPYVITADGKSLSLLSGYNNFKNALGNYFDEYGDGVVFAWKPMLASNSHRGTTCSPLNLTKPLYPRYDYYALDPYGEYPDDCSIYNGVTTASTKEELEAAFGENCIKTDSYYAEIFLDDKEFNYSKKHNYPADFSEFYSYSQWFKYIKTEYPDTETITVLICSYHDNSPNDIEFYTSDTL